MELDGGTFLQQKNVAILWKKGSNTTSTSSESTDIVDQLESLKKLYLSGVLTEEEFNDAKNKLLSQ